MGYIGNQSAKIVSVNLDSFKGEVADITALNAITGMTSGDMYKLIDTNHAYMYDGTQWVDMGDIQGPQGIQGNGIDTIVRTAGDGSEGTVDTYTITFTDTTTTTFNVTNGTAGTIDHIARTAGDGSAGTTDTYTAYADAGETQVLGTFNVYNGTNGINGIDGADGQDVDHVIRTSGDGSPGTTDIYTVWGDVGETINLGTFTVYNGSNGLGSVQSVIGGNGATIDATDPNNPIVIVNTIDNLTDSSAINPLSANQGRLLSLNKANISDVYTQTQLNTGQLDSRYYTESETNTLLNSKQNTLISGSNIKTINGESILGSGDIVISGGGGGGDVTLDTSTGQVYSGYIPITNTVYNFVENTSLTTTNEVSNSDIYDESTQFGYSHSSHKNYYVASGPLANVDGVEQAGKIHLYKILNRKLVYIRSFVADTPITNARIGFYGCDVYDDDTFVYITAMDANSTLYVWKTNVDKFDSTLIGSVSNPATSVNQYPTIMKDTGDTNKLTLITISNSDSTFGTNRGLLCHYHINKSLSSLVTVETISGATNLHYFGSGFTGSNSVDRETGTFALGETYQDADMFVCRITNGVYSVLTTNTDYSGDNYEYPYITIIKDTSLDSTDKIICFSFNLSTYYAYRLSGSTVTSIGLVNKVNTTRSYILSSGEYVLDYIIGGSLHLCTNDASYNLTSTVIDTPTDISGIPIMNLEHDLVFLPKCKLQIGDETNAGKIQFYKFPKASLQDLSTSTSSITATGGIYQGSTASLADANICNRFIRFNSNGNTVGFTYNFSSPVTFYGFYVGAMDSDTNGPANILFDTSNGTITVDGGSNLNYTREDWLTDSSGKSRFYRLDTPIVGNSFTISVYNGWYAQFTDCAVVGTDSTSPTFVECL